MTVFSFLSQAKNIQQAEIDAAAELVDFLRFNVMFSQVSHRRLWTFSFYFVTLLLLVLI